VATIVIARWENELTRETLQNNLGENSSVTTV